MCSFLLNIRNDWIKIKPLGKSPAEGLGLHIAGSFTCSLFPHLDLVYIISAGGSVGDPDPEPDPQDPHVFSQTRIQI